MMCALFYPNIREEDLATEVAENTSEKLILLLGILCALWQNLLPLHTLSSPDKAGIDSAPSDPTLGCEGAAYRDRTRRLSN